MQLVTDSMLLQELEYVTVKFDTHDSAVKKPIAQPRKASVFVFLYHNYLLKRKCKAKNLLYFRRCRLEKKTHAFLL